MRVWNARAFGDDDSSGSLTLDSSGLDLGSGMSQSTDSSLASSLFDTPATLTDSSGVTSSENTQLQTSSLLDETNSNAAGEYANTSGGSSSSTGSSSSSSTWSDIGAGLKSLGIGTSSGGSNIAASSSSLLIPGAIAAGVLLLVLMLGRRS